MISHYSLVVTDLRKPTCRFFIRQETTRWRYSKPREFNTNIIFHSCSIHVPFIFHSLSMMFYDFPFIFHDFLWVPSCFTHVSITTGWLPWHPMASLLAASGWNPSPKWKPVDPRHRDLKSPTVEKRHPKTIWKMGILWWLEWWFYADINGGLMGFYWWFNGIQWDLVGLEWWFNGIILVINGLMGWHWFHEIIWNNGK